MAADGSIVIQMRADGKSALEELRKAEQGLLNIQNAAERAQEAITVAEQRLATAAANKQAAETRAAETQARLDAQRAEIDAEKAKLAEMQQQTKELALQQKEQEKATAAVEQARKAVQFFREEDRVLTEGSPQEQLAFIEQYSDMLKAAADGKITFESVNEELQKQQANLDAIKARIDELTAATQGKDALGEQIKANEENLKDLENEWKGVQREVDRYAQEIEKANDSIQAQQELLSQLLSEEQARTEEVARAQAEFEEIQSDLDYYMPRTRIQLNIIHRIVRRIGSYFRRVFIFSVITSALRSIRAGLAGLLKQNTQLQESLARLKGTLLSAFAPIWQAVEPLLIRAVDLIERAAAGVSEVIAHIFGATREAAAEAAEAMYNQVKQTQDLEKATKKAGKAAKTAEADFDQLHKLNISDENTEETPKITFETETPEWAKALAGWIDDVRDRVQKIIDTGLFDKILEDAKKIGSKIIDLIKAILPVAGDLILKFLDFVAENADTLLPYIEAIGLAFLTWKLSRMLFTDLRTCTALALSVAGAFLLASGYMDAWKNGLNGENLTKTLLGIALIVGALAIRFKITGFAIGLLLGGIALIVLGLKDWIEKGYATNEAMAALTLGILAVGAAIAILTHSFIPLIVAAAVAAVALIIANWDKIKAFFKKLWESIKETAEKAWGKITSVFEKAWEGITGVFTRAGNGIKTITGNIVGGIKQKINEAFQAITDWGTRVQKRAEERTTSLLNLWHRFTSALSDRWRDFKQGWADLFQAIADGARRFKEDFVGIWRGIWDGIKNIINNIIGGAETMLNAIREGLAGIVGGIMSLPTKLLDAAGIGFISVSSTTTRLPRLAQGAVIPANREFLAVLGDQKAGTNIEAPLTTIEQALRNVLQEQGGGDMTVVVQMGSEKIAEKVIKHINQLSRARGSSVIRV